MDSALQEAWEATALAKAEITNADVDLVKGESPEISLQRAEFWLKQALTLIAGHYTTAEDDSLRCNYEVNQ